MLAGYPAARGDLGRRFAPPATIHGVSGGRQRLRTSSRWLQLPHRPPWLVAGRNPQAVGDLDPSA